MTAAEKLRMEIAQEAPLPRANINAMFVMRYQFGQWFSV